jgi:hypothetical protein
MAVFVFSKNSDDKIGAVVGIAENQSVLDNNWDHDQSNYDLVTVTDDLFNDVRLTQKEIVSKNGDTVNTENLSLAYNYRAGLTAYINKQLSEMNAWLERNPSKPLASTITTYKNYISNIDVDTLITDPSADAIHDTSTGLFSDGTPFNSSLEKYVEDQGVTAVHSKQLL